MKKAFDKIYRKIFPIKWAKSNGMLIGKNCVFIAKHKVNFGSEPYLIKLGDEVKVSEGVRFVTHDGGTWAFRDQEKYKDVVKFGTIIIGNRSFIGTGAIILPGVVIGERCVVGAGSVVTADVPDNTGVAGVPAKPIKTTKEYAEKCLEEYSSKGYDTEEIKKDKRRYLTKFFGGK